MPCKTFCTRFVLRVDGHRCADCGMTVEQARTHHEPKFEVRPYGPSVTTEPAYQAWQDWYAKVRALRLGARELDVRFVTEGDMLLDPDDPPVYALHRSSLHGWWVMPRSHEATSWPMFVPVFEEYLPDGDSVRGHPVRFAVMNNEDAPGFVFMTPCTCGWFRPASEPTCTKHDDSPGFPGL